MSVSPHLLAAATWHPGTRLVGAWGEATVKRGLHIRPMYSTDELNRVTNEHLRAAVQIEDRDGRETFIDQSAFSSYRRALGGQEATVRLVRRTLGVALWRLGFQSRDMGPVRPASIQYVERLAVEAVFGTFDNDRDEGRL